MVTSSADLSIKVWGAEGMESSVRYGVGYVPCEGIIASGAADGAICLFVENQDGLERRGAMYEFLLTKEKARETEVTAVQWGPKEIGLLASSSDDGTVKIWELTPHQ